MSLYRYYFLTYILDGCPCPNYDCPSLHPDDGTCEDLSENWNFIQCEKILAKRENDCKYDCETTACYEQCAVDYIEGLNLCPCGAGCENDCPCEKFNCDLIPKEEQNILVLHSPENMALRINYTG